MIFSRSQKSEGTQLRRTTSKDLLERPIELELTVGDVVYGRVNDVWRRVIIVDAGVGKRDAEKKKKVYQGMWETSDSIVMRGWFCPALDGALKPMDDFHTGLLQDPEVHVLF